MALNLAVEGSRFRVQTEAFSTAWVPDTLSIGGWRLVWLRLLRDERGKRLFTSHCVHKFLLTERE